MYVRMYLCMCVCVCMYVCMYVCMHVCLYIRMYVRMYACMYAFVYDAIECSLNQLSARLPPGERRDGAMDDWWRRDFGGYGGFRASGSSSGIGVQGTSWHFASWAFDRAGA